MLVRASTAMRRGLPRSLYFGGEGRGLSGIERGGNKTTADCFPLNRALLRLQGPEAETFLQGLLTNDVARLTAVGGPPDATRALYSHVLNVQGRCLYDVILYRIHESLQEEPHILLECDASILDSLQKHLKLYKIRRKVNIMPCPDLSLWAVIPKEQSEEGTGELQQCPSKAVVVTPDPRVAVMGWRLITSKGTDPLEVVPGSQIGNMKDYHRHRYKQGIPEGVKDLPSGTALPLESNLAYMNGISFTKGCYIGQELTARTHHMGVIRKRLLPIQLSTPVPSESIFEGAEIVSESGKSAGKYRAGVDNLGIALLRLANMNEPLRLKIPGCWRHRDSSKSLLSKK
ncbi:putative transferase CAF17, mitochondrial isoform X1 [Rhineura floridana]|uniref:putative transferase CAF17, mitochondrial isoform X1 n=1 Tax=Rhineura floridana TaxID=261503 RepID=UPI002AC83E4A|nr:putative transferase CAF17, mitochondrial isoform X1 [Rhineura floridana]